MRPFRLSNPVCAMIPAFFKCLTLPFPATVHLGRGSADSSASYLDSQCHIKTPLSSNYIVCKEVADETQQPSCNLGHYGSAVMKRRKSARGETWTCSDWVEWRHDISGSVCVWVSCLWAFLVVSCLLSAQTISSPLHAPFPPSHAQLPWMKSKIVRSYFHWKVFFYICTSVYLGKKGFCSLLRWHIYLNAVTIR